VKYAWATLADKYKLDKLAIHQSIGHTNYAFTVDHYTEKDIEFLNSEMKKIRFFNQND
jgi:hypothetical protein